MPLTQEEKIQLYNYCLQHMNLAAMSLGSSNARAASGGNLAFLEVSLGGQLVFREHAFSNSSSLGRALRADFSPSVPQNRLGMVGVANGIRHANHTEPKLFESFINAVRGGNGQDFDLIILASQLDCCASCVKNTLAAINGIIGLLSLDARSNLRFVVVEINSARVREGHEF